MIYQNYCFRIIIVFTIKKTLQARGRETITHRHCNVSNSGLLRKEPNKQTIKMLCETKILALNYSKIRNCYNNVLQNFPDYVKFNLNICITFDNRLETVWINLLYFETRHLMNKLRHLMNKYALAWLINKHAVIAEKQMFITLY